MGRGGAAGRVGRRLAPLGLVLGLILLGTEGCSAGAPTPAPGRISVVATTTVLADLVRQVAGARAAVVSLVPKGGDVHTFDPQPSSLRAVAAAALIVRNGLGLDDWVVGLVANTGSRAPVVAAAEDLPDVAYLAGEGPPGSVNPHVWMDVANASAMVAKIAAALEAADPAGTAAYAADEQAYRAQLASLDAEIRTQMATIPADNRTVVSFHDAFPYFAEAYGLRIDGTIVAAPGQDPSAGSMAELVAVIRRNHVRAVFAEAQFNDELARTISAETGIAVVSDLYTDTLGDPPLDTYTAVMRWNVNRVAGALGGS